MPADVEDNAEALGVEEMVALCRGIQLGRCVSHPASGESSSYLPPKIRGYNANGVPGESTEEVPIVPVGYAYVFDGTSLSLHNGYDVGCVGYT
jgi:hypothetical protein